MFKNDPERRELTREFKNCLKASEIDKLRRTPVSGLVTSRLVITIKSREKRGFREFLKKLYSTYEIGSLVHLFHSHKITQGHYGQ